MAGFPNPTAGNDASQDRASIQNQGHDIETPAITLGAGLGTSPPAAVVRAGSNDLHGNVSLGTGTTPAAGIWATVTFTKPFEKAPSAVLVGFGTVNVPGNLYVVDNISATSFQVGCTGAPAASQASGTYGFHYIVVP